jgi:hypothetical protein
MQMSALSSALLLGVRNAWALGEFSRLATSHRFRLAS